ncbi:hypothetical protein EWM64_g5442 [Hericium alpestre]|uniref:Uncharacterized protein n=1 Tax=Hericium alpestre TaxID=135208 RepID=A0A4Y9ZUM6_9AGAM|nr:hypothetical protein EWM64_g5442 [Hericium alpestre]
MLPHLLTYAAKVCDLLAVHLQGDAQFFMHPSLRKILGPACAPDISAVLGKVAQLRAAVDKWMKQSADFDGAKLVAALAFGDEVAGKMKTQVMAVDSKRLAAGMKEDELKQMMQANIEWFASQSDIVFLIPFLLSHHDRATSTHWPPITSEGRAALPGLVQQYARCWEMAPFDCVTGKKK